MAGHMKSPRMRPAGRGLDSTGLGNATRVLEKHDKPTRFQTRKPGFESG